MGAKVYCLGSAKGGSGKTIIAASLASFLSHVGKKCALIDCDAATYGMTLLYVVEVSAHSGSGKAGLFDLTPKPDGLGGIPESVITLDNGVDFMPATYRFSAHLDPEKNIEPDILREVVDVMRPKYDLIFLDAQAGSDSWSRFAMHKSISDEVIIVSEYDPLSVAGVERLKRLAGEDLEYDRTWILLNKMLPEFVERFSEFLSIAQYLPPIPWNADVVRSYARRKTALDLDRGNEYTLAVKRTIAVLLGDDIRNQLDAWSEERADALKAPLDEQYLRAESELASALVGKRDLERRSRIRAIWRVYAVAVGVGILPVSIAMRFGTENLLSTELLMFSFALALFAILWALSTLWNRSKTPESARYDRLIRRLEDRLQGLEALRAASLETIVRSGTSRREDSHR